MPIYKVLSGLAYLFWDINVGMEPSLIISYLMILWGMSFIPSYLFHISLGKEATLFTTQKITICLTINLINLVLLRKVDNSIKQHIGCLGRKDLSL